MTYFFAGVEGGGGVRTFYSNELNCLRERHKEKIGPVSPPRLIEIRQF